MTQITLNVMQDALQSAPVGILMLDNKGNIQWHNSTLETLLNIHNKSLSEKSSKDLPDDLRGMLIDPPETILLQQGEQQRWLRSERQTIEGQGKVHFYFDISSEQQLRCERDQLAEDLQQLTTRDPVTGLPNRRALLQGLEPLVSRSRRYDNPLSIIKLNATLSGSSISSDTQADAWMKIGQLLKDQMRWADIIGRFDGADFLLILPETPEEAAHQLASKLCELVAELQIKDNDGHSLKVQPYCGIAGWNKGDDATLMLRRVSDGVAAAREAGIAIASA